MVIQCFNNNLDYNYRYTIVMNVFIGFYQIQLMTVFRFGLV